MQRLTSHLLWYYMTMSVPLSGFVCVCVGLYAKQQQWEEQPSNQPTSNEVGVKKQKTRQRNELKKELYIFWFTGMVGYLSNDDGDNNDEDESFICGSYIVFAVVAFCLFFFFCCCSYYENVGQWVVVLNPFCFCRRD